MILQVHTVITTAIAKFCHRVILLNFCINVFQNFTHHSNSLVLKLKLLLLKRIKLYLLLDDYLAKIS